MEYLHIYIPLLLVLINSLYVIIKTMLTYKTMINSINYINNKSLEQKMDMTDTTFDIFEQNSVINVKHILDQKCVKDDIQYLDSFELLEKYNQLKKDLQLLHYRFVWVENKQELKTRFRKMIKRNGFHEKEGDVLDRYIELAFETLFTESKNNINNHMDSYNCLEDTTADDRFNISEAKILFRGLVLSCIEIEKNCIKEINELQKKRKLGRKIIAIIGKFLRKN